MTRQRRLKRRIRARMAKTGESYSTARREVLKRLGTVADRPEAPEARPPRRIRTRIGVAGLVLAVTIAAVIVVATERTDGPSDGGPPTASPSENPELAERCRLMAHDARRLPGHAPIRRLLEKCNRALRLSAMERDEVRSYRADELPPRLRRLLMRQRLCGAIRPRDVVECIVDARRRLLRTRPMEPRTNEVRVFRLLASEDIQKAMGRMRKRLSAAEIAQGKLHGSEVR
jgi:hypothetical protein